ncbi:class I SAM-dependent methyltransferase [Streptococcus iniae]|nr:class I SAM-dependent methyltransferase [Streptococcus iniae]
MSKQKFDGYADKYDGWFVANEPLFQSEFQLVKTAIESVEHNHILSIGCGSGLFEIALKAESIIVEECVEPSEDMARIAKMRGLNVQIATAQTAEFENEVYDLIYFNGSSSYFEDLEEAYSKCYKALKKGGHLITFDVPKESAYGILYSLAKQTGSYSHPDITDVAPKLPYPIELAGTACWHTVKRLSEALINSHFSEDINYMQTLCNNPIYTDSIVENVREGYKEGGYVALIAKK